jgi:hypothetical protein
MGSDNHYLIEFGGGLEINTHKYKKSEAFADNYWFVHP